MNPVLKTACLFLVLSACFLIVHGQVLGDACEKTQNNVTTYHACFPSAEKLTQSAPHTLNVSPESATCGNPPVTYCKETFVLGCLSEDVCDVAIPEKNHPPNFMVDNNFTTWWQSILSSNRNEFLVTIQLSFDKLYELAGSLRVVFSSGRPRNMTIEKSSDNGQSWQPLQYYSQDCSGFPVSPVTSANPSAVICSTDYSSANPKTGGIVQFSDRLTVLLGPTLTDYKTAFETLNSNTDLQQLFLFSDIRLALNIPAVIGNPHGDYYGITEIEINGRCFCNLHASKCDIVNGETVCVCQHNTRGIECTECKPLYNEREWRKGSYVPFPEGTANECQKCECNDHALSCYYDPTYGRGICNDCMHNTEGNHCQNCILGYYHNESVLLTSPDTCIVCDCEPLGIIEGGSGCAQSTIGQFPIGQCPCKSQVTGRRCDGCTPGFYGLLLDQPLGVCKPCNCNTFGTTGGSNVCDTHTGQCPCKTSTNGRTCGQCKDGFFGFPLQSNSECSSCNCDWGGSSSNICNSTTGQCTCQPNIQGDKCTSVTPGNYRPHLDDERLEPISGSCVLEQARQITIMHDGTGFARCTSSQMVNFEDRNGQVNQPEIQWPYRLAVRYSHNSPQAWPQGLLTVTVSGNSGLQNVADYQQKQTEIITSLNCHQIGQIWSFNVTFTAGVAQAWFQMDADAIVLDARCQYKFTLTFGPASQATDTIIIDSIILIPSLTRYAIYQSADSDTRLAYEDCLMKMSSFGSRSGRLPDLCNSLAFSVMSQIHMGATACDCDPMGSLSTDTCAELGGQCSCKPGVGGRQCNRCQEGFYNFTDTGCTACNCEPTGSENGVCDVNSGQCPCLINVARDGETDITNQIAGKTCTACKENHYGYVNEAGCTACACSPEGATGTQCTPDGQCPCKDTTTGLRCADCKPEYYDFSVTGCKHCNCTTAGVTSHDCDKVTGVCQCKQNTEGDKCDSCKPGYFNLLSTNSYGCQKCFCYGHGLDCSSALGFVQSPIMADNAQSWQAAPPLPNTHVSAPQQFLGNKVYSYGQYISMDIMAVTADVDLSLYDNVVVLEGEGTMLYSTVNMTVNSLGYSTVKLSLHQDNWRVNGVDMATADQMQSVLASLSGLYIRRFYAPLNMAVRNIELMSAEAALEGDTRPVAMFVEQCSCDPSRNVAGLSCESCSQGNRRPTNMSSEFDPCIPCDCNGKQDGDLMCDQISGKCLNCRNGTAGDNCERCAPNVVASPECNECEDGFWGLFAEGCIACNCSVTGSASSVCDKTTGQCTCKFKVTGLQCDVCEDNYFNLSETGCEVCNDCYGLVEVEVNKLRTNRDNLTNLVQELKANDRTSDLGRFTQRLSQTQVTLDTLIVQLTQAESIESSQAVTVSGLKQDAEALLVDVDQNEPNTLSNIESELRKTRLAVQDSRNAVVEVNNTVYSTLSIVEELTQQVTTLKDSADSLVVAQQQFSSMAASTTNHLASLENEVVDIETVTLDTQNTSSSALQVARQLSTLQTSISTRVSSLVSSISALINLVDQLRTTLTDYIDQSIVEGVSVSDLEQKVSSHQVPNQQEVLNLQTQAVAIQNSAEALQTQALSDAQSSTLDVETTRALEQSVSELQRARTIQTQSDLLLENIRAASNIAETARVSEMSTFTNAENMLNTLQNFQTIIIELQQQYQAAQQSAEEVRTLSIQTISASQKLREDLRVTYNNAERALQFITTAHDLQTNKRDSLVPVNAKAQQLQQDSNQVLNDIDSQAARVGVANNTYVIPADQVCQSLKAAILKSTNASRDARLEAEQVKNLVDLTRDKANTLLRSLLNIQEINTADIERLRSEVRDNRDYFDRRGLSEEFTSLGNRVMQQQAWIDAAVARRDKLLQDLENLKVTQGLLVHENN